MLFEGCAAFCIFAEAQIGRRGRFEGKGSSLEIGSESHRLHSYEKNVGSQI